MFDVIRCEHEQAELGYRYEMIVDFEMREVRLEARHDCDRGTQGRVYHRLAAVYLLDGCPTEDLYEILGNEDEELFQAIDALFNLFVEVEFDHHANPRPVWGGDEDGYEVHAAKERLHALIAQGLPVSTASTPEEWFGVDNEDDLLGDLLAKKSPTDQDFRFQAEDLVLNAWTEYRTALDVDEVQAYLSVKLREVQHERSLAAVAEDLIPRIERELVRLGVDEDALGIVDGIIVCNEEDGTVTLTDEDEEVTLPAATALARLRLIEDGAGHHSTWEGLHESRWRPYNAQGRAEAWEQLVGSQSPQKFVENCSQGEDVSAIVAEYLDDLRTGSQGLGVDFAESLTDREINDLQIALMQVINDALHAEAAKAGYKLAPSRELPPLFPDQLAKIEDGAGLALAEELLPEQASTSDLVEIRWSVDFRRPIIARKFWGVRWGYLIPEVE